MNNKIITGIVVVIVIIGAVFLVTRNKGSESDVASDTQSASSATETSVENGSIKSLISAGSTRKCTFKSTESGVESSGTVYASSGKMRGDFSATIDGKQSVTHMLYDGTTSHVWVDGQATGFKMKLDAESTASAQNQSVDPNKNYEFNCEKWSAEQSKFDLPSGITFSELPTLPTGTLDANAQTSGAINSKDLQKTVCNGLSEPEKTQCLAAIK